MQPRIRALAATLAIGALAGPAAAQDDLIQRFQAQQQIVDERGLSVSPVVSTGSTRAGTAAGSAAATGAGGTGTATGTASGTGRTGGRARLAPEEAAYQPMPSDAAVNIRIEFALDSAVLRESEVGKLETVCEAVRALDQLRFNIFGHTDVSGSAAHNLRLSRRRAESVRTHMVRQCGLPGERLRAFGVGEGHPLPGSDPRAPENRRVEFQTVG
ncbi:hypothetical protein LNKW23_11780 [Paralimibaculum aggregatum]|uniref:OmpA-like domain-containing protein n=1 Tax=Paralimibaculum aggregatum TaxID=3036245 RepID=A0ABQ6LIB7_9RHOB|nr:OmpA family protein [Limibaculum sp. NKW23]GMG81965.1 hypothetical protein LNKW23_11780 [Limibaculum sp. NKW23]